MYKYYINKSNKIYNTSTRQQSNKTTKYLKYRDHIITKPTRSEQQYSCPVFKFSSYSFKRNMLKPKATTNITTTCLQTHVTMYVIGATSTK